MNLRNLEYFVNVARLGSVTHAAEKMYVSQSAVSKMIKQLEEELGVQLFDREGRTIVLNQKGKLFYSYVSDSLNLLQRGINAVQTLNDKAFRPMNILFTVASPLIPDIVLQMKAKIPQLIMNIQQRNSFAKDLKQFDFVISTQKIPNFISIPLLTEEIMVGWQKKLLSSRSFITLKELKQYDLVGLSNNTELQTVINQYLARKEIKLDFKYQTDEPATARRLIASGLGVGFIPRVTWQGLAYSKDIYIARILPDSPRRTVYLNTPYQRLNNEQRLFSNEIANVFLKARDKARKEVPNL